MPQKSVDPFSVHEALDRAHLMATIFSEFVAEHSFVRATPKLRREADRLAEGLGMFYQRVGQFAFPEEKSSSPKRLAMELGISPKTLREFLRKKFPRDAMLRGSRWRITEEHKGAARRKWDGR
jgi:hypothetical protein